jgi:hypothetical protein
MKRIMFLLIAWSMFTLYGIAQNMDPTEIPGQVRKMFSTQFPKVEKCSWSTNKENYFVAFSIDEVKYSVTYDKDGNFLEKDTEIRTADLPKPVKESIRKDLPDAVINKALKTETAEKRIFYNLVATKGPESVQAQYSPAGELLGKQPVEKTVVKTDAVKKPETKTTEDKSKKAKSTDSKSQDKKPKDVKTGEPKTK